MVNLNYDFVARLSSFLERRSIHIPRGWIIIALAIASCLLVSVLVLAIYLLVAGWPR